MIYIILILFIVILFFSFSNDNVMKKIEEPIRHTPISKTQFKELCKNSSLPYPFLYAIFKIETAEGKKCFNYNLFNITGTYKNRYFRYKQIPNLIFRSYPSFQDSIKDFEDLILNSKRYKKTVEYIQKNDLPNALKELILAGYAGHYDYQRYINALKFA